MTILAIIGLILFLSNPEYWKLIKVGFMGILYFILASFPFLGILGLLAFRIHLI